jgi:hypothetical protein
MRKGPNFAGYYRVVVWGCGTSCAEFAVVSLRTGNVIVADGIKNVSGVHFAADEFLPSAETKDAGFRFRRDSRLLVLIGAMNEDESNEGVFYYALLSDRLQLVHKTLAIRATCKEENE